MLLYASRDLAPSAGRFTLLHLANHIAPFFCGAVPVNRHHWISWPYFISVTLYFHSIYCHPCLCLWNHCLFTPFSSIVVKFRRFREKNVILILDTGLYLYEWKHLHGNISMETSPWAQRWLSHFPACVPNIASLNPTEYTGIFCLTTPWLSSPVGLPQTNHC